MRHVVMATINSIQTLTFLLLRRHSITNCEMPFFGNKFSPKKTPRRKSNTETPKEALTDQRTVHLKLGEQQFVFENGDWIPETGKNSATYQSKQKLKKKIQDLEEENYLLKLKYEMMLNMLTQAAAKGDFKEVEFDKLRKQKK